MEHRWLYYIPGSAVSELHQVMRENNVNSAIEIVLQFIPLSGNTDQRRQICTVSIILTSVEIMHGKVGMQHVKLWKLTMIPFLQFFTCIHMLMN